ncbi:Phosphatidylinositol 3,5-bisphosphate-binding protein [Elasticomyces elasticus]|nr:Phosphatidylinositol 3,5-bisphosphate-binding protein [Elasticomyces elasticus]
MQNSTDAVQLFEQKIVSESIRKVCTHAPPSLSERDPAEPAPGNGIGIVEAYGDIGEMHHCKFLATVGGGRRPNAPRRKIQFWTQEAEDSLLNMIKEMDFFEAIHGVRVNSNFIMVILIDRIVKLLDGPKLFHADDLYDTGKNPYAICCLGEKVMIYPSSTLGQLQVVGLDSGSKKVIAAHSSPLRRVRGFSRRAIKILPIFLVALSYV